MTAVGGIGRSFWASCRGGFALALMIAAGCAGSSPHVDASDSATDSSVPADSDGAPEASVHTGCLTGWPMPNPPSTGLPHPQNYDTSAPGVVLDTVTGLRWERSIEDFGYTWRDANAYCTGLTISGVGGWRLPSVVELVSIVDFTRADPAIDPDAFPGTPGIPFWTSQTDSANSGLAWYVYFKNGGAYNGNDVVDVQRVRCVR